MSTLRIGLFIALFLMGPVPLQAEGDPSPAEELPDGIDESDASEVTEGIEEPGEKAPDYSGLSAQQRLDMARVAFRSADYQVLIPLLRGLTDDNTQLPARAQRVEARQILGVAYFFESQRVRGAPALDLEARARSEFERLLDESPEFQLDPLIFPSSVVEFFQRTRFDYLGRNGLDQGNGPVGGDTTSETLYIERLVQERVFALNFMPFGIGQFQNESYIKGTAFAVLQAISLGANIAGYSMVERLRGPDGRYDVDDGSFAEALGWQRVQYTGLISFGVLYAFSVADALLSFERQRVRIRTLDAPPRELQGRGIDATPPELFRVGWSLEWLW